MGPELDHLRLFAAVVEAGGFRPAARRLGLSASTLSDVVRRLEEQLAVRLLNRSTRSAAPTEAGARLLDRLRPALEMVASSLDALHEDPARPAGLLRLSVPGIVARLVLPSILPGFMRRHPAVNVEVAVSEDVVDLVQGGFDAGVRYRERVAADMTAVPIGPRRQRYVLAAAPDYLTRHGRPQHPRDLAQHRLIGHRFASGTLVVWDFRCGSQVVRITPTDVLTTSSIDLRQAAAAAGVGLLYTFEEVTRSLVAEGALEPLLEEWWDSFEGPLLCFHRQDRLPPPLRALVAYLAEPNAG